MVVPAKRQWLVGSGRSRRGKATITTKWRGKDVYVETDKSSAKYGHNVSFR